jgi:hypothetical protein
LIKKENLYIHAQQRDVSDIFEKRKTHESYFIIITIIVINKIARKEINPSGKIISKLLVLQYKTL